MAQGRKQLHKNHAAYQNGLNTFRDLKSRFDRLGDELRKIHADWLTLQQQSRTVRDKPLEQELFHREAELLQELQQVLKATDEVLREITDQRD